MKVLFLNYEYPPLGGGAGNAMFYIFREYSKIPGLEIDCITSSIDENYHIENLGSNIRIHRLPIGKNKNNLHFQSQKDILLYAWKAYFFSRKLIKLAKREGWKYNLTHAFFSVPCGFLAMLLKKEFSIPYIVSLRGADVPGYSERFSFVYNFLKPLIKMVWAQADSVISVSHGLKDLALKSSPDQKIGVIYNGVDIDEFYPKYNYSGDVFNILCLTRLTPRKGVAYLIDAIEKLAEKYPNIKLKIVGEGDSKQELLNQVQKLSLEDKIEFLGIIRHENLPPIYRNAQVFVLPSLNEGMSNVILEAIASGLPVITTDTGGSKELVQDGVNGFIVKMKDSNDIAEKLEKLISDSELCSDMSKESRSIAEGLSWNRTANKYVDVYYKTIAK